ncbi:MAG: ABC transporter ATP-binding protein [Thermoleophilia bacterium]
MLRAEGLAVRYGATVALAGVDLEVPDRRVVAVLGPSGCGKTSLLRVVAGLEPAATGVVSWDGRPLTGVPAHERGFGLMFQDYALFPHKTVFGNVSFGLRMEGRPTTEIAARVSEVLEWVGLTGYEERPVGPLSGGEQQRVALARALAPAPHLLMLDEPLGSLDRGLRERLVTELRQLLTGRGVTAIYVTHDQEEAFAVSDTVVIMRAGRIAQQGPAEEVWRHPVDEWVAGFLGFDVIVDAHVRAGRAEFGWGRISLPGVADGERRLVLRPDALSLDASGAFSGHVVGRSFRGGHYLLRVRVESGVEVELEVGRSRLPGEGDQVRFAIDPEAVSVVG